MDFTIFLRTLWRWSWLILLGTVIGVASSYYALRSLGYFPVYEARVIVGIGTQLGPDDQSLENLYMGRELTPTYVELVTLRPVTQAVIDDLQISMTPQGLAENLRVDLIPDTQYLRITAVDRNPVQAAAIANAIAHQLAKQTPPRLRSLIQIVEPASPPNVPSFRPLIAVFIAGLFGLFLALGLVFVVERVNDTIRIPADVTRHFGLPVFGTVRPNRSLLDRLLRRSPILTLPNLTHQPVWWTTIEGCRHIWNGIEQNMIESHGKRILITSPGRSEGKTTAAIGIAAAWAKTGLKVALIETHLDIPALGNRLGLSDYTDITAWVNGDLSHLEPAPLGSFQSGALQVLAFERAVQEPLDLIPSPRFQQELTRISRQVDLLVLDGPPVLATAEAPILAGQADGILLVVRIGKTRINALKETLRTLELVGGTVLGVVFFET